MMFHAASNTESNQQLIVCWSPKGGSGTSVVAALLALCLAQRTDTVLLDAAGDQAAIFAMESADVGFIQWLSERDDLPGEALARLARSVKTNLRLVPSGPGAVDSSGDVVARIRESFPTQMIVVDAGLIRDAKHPWSAIVEASDVSVVVMRPCYLAAQRALLCELRRDGLIVIDEPARALSAADISEVLNSPVFATLNWDSALARTVDAGRLTKRFPRSARSLQKLCENGLSRAS